jgi:UDP-N-acetylmuramate--alanine ligase
MKYEFELGVPGYHNVLNATAASALALNLGVSKEAVAEGLAHFQGVERRFQVLTSGLPVTVIDDYAHHPTEIAAVLGTARERYPGRRIWGVFQAHQHSRTRTLFEEFARSLIYADRVTIARIFSVRETELDRKSVNGADIAGRLFQLSVDSEYVPGFSEIESLLHEQTREGDVVVVMGAGDIYKVAHSFARAVKERSKRELSGLKTSV